MKEFVQDREREINDLNREFLKLYNELGVKSNDARLQASFFALYFIVLFKSCNLSKNSFLEPIFKEIRSKV